MYRLNELTQELCPDGVEYKKAVSIAGVGTESSNENEAQDDEIYPIFV